MLIVRKLIFLFLIFYQQILFSQTVVIDELSLYEEYIIMYFDLQNYQTIGYKGHWIEYLDRENQKYYSQPSRTIDFSQGTFRTTNRDLDFAIYGDGFFKIILEDGTVAYTRAGEFIIDKNTMEVITLSGHRLFDNIIIKPGFLKIEIDDNKKLMIYYQDGEKIEAGLLVIYNVDTSKLKMIKNSPEIFLYSGDEETISVNKIINGAVEESNVLLNRIMVRLFQITPLIKESIKEEQERKRE